jgi:hypothetical protein
MGCLPSALLILQLYYKSTTGCQADLEIFFDFFLGP